MRTSYQLVYATTDPFDSLAVEADSSATAEIAAVLPNSRVRKALNTTVAAMIASREVGPVPTTLLIAGDDAEAEALLAEGHLGRPSRGVVRDAG